MQDLDKFKNEMNLSGKNVYVGHRYVPKIMGDWDNTQIYEPLTIVQYEGNSYTSRQYVPSGIEITNEEYWVSTGNYNAQVEQYRQDVRNLENDVNNINGEVISARNGEATLNERLVKERQEVNEQFSQIVTNVKTFGAKGDGVTDDTQAIQEAIDFTASNGGGTVYFPVGNYVCTETIIVTPTYFDVDGRSVGRINIEGANFWGSRLEFKNATGNGLHVVSLNTTVKDIAIVDAPQNGLYVKGSYRSNYNLTIKNVYVTGALKNGFYFEDVFMATIERCYAYGSGEYGFKFVGHQTSLNIINNYANKASLGGFYLENASYSSLLNNAADNVGIGYTIIRPKSVSMFSNGCEVSEHAVNISGEESTLDLKSLHTYRIEKEEIIIDGVLNSVIKIEGGNSIQPIQPTTYSYIRVDDASFKKVSLLDIIDVAQRSNLVGGVGASKVLLEKNYPKAQDTTNLSPTIKVGGSDTGITYESNSGSYRKIGRIVFFSINITVSSIGDLTGNITIEGFTEPSSIYGEITPIVNRHNIPNVTDLHMRFDGSYSTGAKLYHMTDDGRAVPLDHTNFTRGRIIVSGFYTTY